MIFSDYDLKVWKKEQLEYYGDYQKGFSRDSGEYKQLNEKLERLRELL